MFCSRCVNQARSQDLEKGGGGGGGYFERVRKVKTTLTRIFIVLESVSHGLFENGDEISRKARKFKRFFRPKSGGLQKKKVFTEIETDFLAKFGNLNVWGGLFSYGGGGYRPQKRQTRAILHTSQANGGARAHPAPLLATLLVLMQTFFYCILCYTHTIELD